MAKHRAIALSHYPSGNPFIRIRVGNERPFFPIEGDNEASAMARARVVHEIVNDIVQAGHLKLAVELGRRAGAAKSNAELGAVRNAAASLLSGALVTRAKLDPNATVKEFGQLLTSGELHQMFPKRVKAKKTAKQDDLTLNKWVYPKIGSRLVTEVNTEDCEAILNDLPSHLADSTVRHVAQIVSRLFKLAMYPGKLIEKSPTPSGYLPAIEKTKGKTYLYPEEDKLLLGCKEIYLVLRMLYGTLDREGMRLEEALSLQVRDLDQKSGSITLDENKTRDHRTWALDPSVAEALRLWLRHFHPNPRPDAFVFLYPKESRASGRRIARRSAAAVEFREYLKFAKCKRAQLFEASSNRRPICVHDLRATFVTLSLAEGKSETWVADRTGHKSSTMINRYRRQARTHSELDLGPLAPLVDAIPELRSIKKRDTVVDAIAAE